MAFQHGKDTVYTVDSDDLSAFTNTSTLESGVDEHDVTCYGAEDHVVTGGLGNGKFSFGGIYDSGATGPKAVLEPLIDAKVPVAVVRKPIGTGAGKPNEAFSALLTKYVETAPVADMISWSCEGTRSGAITRTTQS